MGRTVTTFLGNILLSHTLLIAIPRLLDPLDSKSSCIMSFGDSSICWPRRITTATFSSGMISIAVGVFHLHFFQAQMLVHPSSSAALGRKSDQGWKTSATPPFTNLIRDVRSRRPDNEILHIQLHASDLAMLPFYSRLIWLIPFPAEWRWLPTWCPGVHPPSYANSELWKKYSNANAQSSSSNVPVVGSMSSSSTSAQSMSSARPTPSCAPTLATVAEQETEPEDTPFTSDIPQSEDVPVPQAFPYVTHTVDSDRDDVKVIARTPFGNTLVQAVCRDMNDVEANEAVVNKHWFRQVADAEAPHFSSKMKEQGVSTRVTERLQQGEAALWSGKQDNGPDSGSSSHALPPDEVQLPLHATLQPSLEHIEDFLADQAKEMELLAAQHLLTMSQNQPSIESETSSQEEERIRMELEYEQALQDREAEEEDQDEDYWKQYYEQLY